MSCYLHKIYKCQLLKKKEQNINNQLLGSSKHQSKRKRKKKVTRTRTKNTTDLSNTKAVTLLLKTSKLLSLDHCRVSICLENLVPFVAKVFTNFATENDCKIFTALGFSVF